ncbi:pentatricopeptide repeat-containing protein At5g14080 [Typha angustifolia]|uniref:pentatricopeptide repeat-containing protein At5g14080 n=1 Tax=Typha angustifolia TaxID=59011 RepID=UPI003C2F1444
MPPPSPPPPPSLCAAARRLAGALLSAASHPTNSSSSSSAIEQTLLLHSPPLTPPLLAATIDPHLLPHPHLSSSLFHFASRLSSFSHTPETYISFLKSLCFSRQFQSIRSLLHQAFSSFLDSNKAQEAFLLYEYTSESSFIEFPVELYNSLLAGFASNGYSAHAWKMFDQMLNRNVAFSDLGFGVFIKWVCREEELGRVLSLVEDVKRRAVGINGSIIALVIVDGLCRVGRIEDAWQALEELRRRGCKPDFIAYRIVSEGFRVAGRMEEAGRILKQKRKLGVAPREKDYREFVLTLVSQRRVLEAKEIGEAIVLGDFPIEDCVLNPLIGSVSAVDPDSAISFCKYIIGKERFLSLETLDNFGRNLCKHGKGDDMWNIFRVLLNKGYFRGADQYHVVVSFLCKAGKLREAYDVLKGMKMKGFDPDIASYNCLMEACCRDDLLRPAKKLWDEIFINGCAANLQTYNILIQKLSEVGEAEESLHLFHHMLSKGVIPDNVTYTALIKMLCREKRSEQAIEVYKKSVEQDVSLATLALSTLIMSLCKEGNFMAASVVMRGVPSDLENTSSHAIFLKSLTDAGEAELALKHIEWVRTNCPSQFETILHELVASLSTAPKLEPIVQLFQAMYAQGLILDYNPWTSLFENHYA